MGIAIHPTDARSLGRAFQGGTQFDRWPLWRDGHPSGEVDLTLPRAAGGSCSTWEKIGPPTSSASGRTRARAPIPQTYRATYLALARGEYPNDHHGARAKVDRYLELYGIPPTLTLLRARFREAQKADCASKVDLEPLKGYQRIVAYVDNPKARRDSAQFLGVEQRMKGLLAKQGVDAPSKLDPAKLGPSEKNLLKTYEKVAPSALVIRAAQSRLKCEGFFDGKASYTDGALDWTTNEAIALVRTQASCLRLGVSQQDTVDALKEPPLEGERQSVHPRSHRAGHARRGVHRRRELFGQRGKSPYVPRKGWKAAPHSQPRERAAQRRHQCLRASDTRVDAWLGSNRWAISRERGRWSSTALRRPEYYSSSMDFSVVIDRGDIWYEFPYDDQGKERPQPVQRRPTLTLFTTYLGEKIPLARYGTTIGGWRSEMIDGTEMWKYKNSPVGPRVWRQIVAAPVWLAPPGTTARTLLTRGKGKGGYVVNLHEIGPSYASAYGLVAAYHSRFKEGEAGEVELQGDEGIRTHGSVDYMSIMQRHSHGCHRLHNHIAVRLMSFVLGHRPHKRVGQTAVGYKNIVEQDGTEYEVKIDKSGYVFQIDRPVPVEVLSGRVLGKQPTPVAVAIPKFDSDAGAYVTPGREPGEGRCVPAR